MSEMLTALAHALVGQVDPNQGTAQAARGAVERLAEPNVYDIASPVIAFVLVIVVPSLVAIWAIVRTVQEKAPASPAPADSADD
jgi:hypothetical protein